MRRLGGSFSHPTHGSDGLIKLYTTHTPMNPNGALVEWQLQFVMATHLRGG